jgi:hypothetical protein
MVEIIPKPQIKSPSWINTLFYSSLVLLVVTILSVFVINQLQKNALNTSQKLAEELEKTKSPERFDLEKQMIGYQKKIADFSYLIQNHELTSNLFTFLEKLVHPKVQFTNFNFIADKSKLVLKGETDNFFNLGQQFLIFKAEPFIKEVNLSEVSIGKEGKIGFSFEIFPSSEILK